jgi:hypothetical protein
LGAGFALVCCDAVSPQAIPYLRKCLDRYFVTRVLAVVVMIAITIMPAFAEQPLQRSEVQGITTCTGAHGYLSRESMWQGFVYGDDNVGGRWLRSSDGRGGTVWNAKRGTATEDQDRHHRRRACRTARR